MKILFFMFNPRSSELVNVRARDTIDLLRIELQEGALAYDIFAFSLSFQATTVTISSQHEFYLTVDFIGDTCLDEIELDHHFRFSPFYACFGQYSPQWLDQIIPGVQIMNHQNSSNDESYSPPSGYDSDRSHKGSY